MRPRVHLGVLATYVAVAYGLTFPTWPSRLRTHIPGDSGDALLNLWIVRWVGHHVDDGWGALWDTTIFHPHDNTLAYSESLLPVGIAHRALALVVRSDVLAFNLLHVGAWTASMFATYLLARRLTGSTSGAFVAGLVYTLATPRLAHYAHFQLAFGFLVPVVVLLVVRFFERPSIGRGAAFGIVTALLALSSSYYGLMTLTALALVVPGLLVWPRERPSRATVTGLAVAAGCALVLVAPVAYQYRTLQEDPHFRRDPEPALSAHPGDFLRVMPGNHLLADRWPFAERSDPEDGTIENRLYPGALAVGLGTFGAAIVGAALRKRRTADPDATDPDAHGAGSDVLGARALVLTAVAGAGLLVLAFGERFVWGPIDVPMPYRVLRDVPGYSSIRATSRFVAFPLLALALLGAVGLQRLLQARPTRVALVVTAACAAFVIAESATAIELTRVSDDPRAAAVNHALDRRPEGVVAELPMGTPADGVAWPYVETPRMWLSRIDGNERISGYSGFDPPGFVDAMEPVEQFPAPEAFNALEELGVRYVVLRTSLPIDLPDWQAEIVDTPGTARYSRAEAAAIVDGIRDDPRVVDVERHGAAWLVELAW